MYNHENKSSSKFRQNLAQLQGQWKINGMSTCSK